MLKPTLTQYNIRVPNDPGRLAELARLLMKEKVKLESVVTAVDGAQAAVQFLARRNPVLREKLEKTATSVREDQVFQAEIPNHHWELHKAVRALAEREINIISLYSSVSDGRLRLVLAVDEPANAVAAMAKLGIPTDYDVYEV